MGQYLQQGLLQAHPGPTGGPAAHAFGGLSGPQPHRGLRQGALSTQVARAAPAEKSRNGRGGGSQPEMAQDRQAEPYLGRPAQTSSDWVPVRPGRR